MKRALFAAACILLLAGQVQAQPVYKSWLNYPTTEDSLVRSSYTTTQWFDYIRPMPLVWVTITSTTMDTIKVYGQIRSHGTIGSWAIDTTDQLIPVFQAERSSSSDTIAITRPIIGSAKYQARFRIYEPIINYRFRLKSAGGFLAPGRWYYEIYAEEK